MLSREEIEKELLEVLREFTATTSWTLTPEEIRKRSLKKAL